MSTTKLKEQLNGKLQTAKSTKSKIVNITETSTLAPVESSYIALTNNAMDIISDNLKNQPLSFQLFDIIKSPSGGITSFSVPGLSGDDMEKELVGIILDYTTPRAYWDTPDPVEGTPPNCWSRDSLTSHDGKSCRHCQFNSFGSKNGGETQAKACKESVHVFLLRPDNIMPLIVRVPVSSKQAFLRYMTRLIGKMISLSGVVTKITLEKTTNKTGQPYSLYNFEAINTLSSDEAATAKAFGQKFMEVLSNTDIEPDIVKAG